MNCANEHEGKKQEAQEIIDRLNRCISDDPFCCDDCPYRNSPNCTNELMADARDLLANQME